MADRAHSWTDWKIEELEKELDKIYARAEKELEDRAQKYFDRFSKLDEQKRALLDAGKLTEEEYNRWKTGKIMTGKHWTEMKEQTAQDLLKVNQTAASYINDQLPAVYTRNYNQVVAGINGQIRGYSFDLVDSATVRRLATDDKTLLPYKYIDGVKDVRWNTGKVNSEILQGILQGDSIPNLAKRLRNVTEMNRASSIRNARTSCTSAENKGRMDMIHDAEDKGVHVKKGWMATKDNRTRESHADLDGVFVDPDEEFDNGLQYPGDPNGEPEEVYNCFVGDTKIASNSEIVRSYKHEYDGRLVTIKTSGGVNFTCTPNHPILTLSGWVAAESLKNGDDLIVTFGENEFTFGIDPDVNHAFPRIDTIHKLIDKLGGKRATALGVNFHGDVATSDVEIVTKERLLRNGFNSGGVDSVDKFAFKCTDKTFSGKRTFVKHFRRIWSTSFSFMRGRCKALSFRFRSLKHAKVHSLRPIALLNSGSVKTLDNDAAGNIELIGECLDGFSGMIFADNIVSVDFNSGRSHVYNLQTQNGYYFVNSIIPQNKEKSNGIFAIAKNCRCTLVYKVMGFRKAESEEEHSLLSEEERETYAERRRERLSARRQESIDFDTAPISDVQKYAETKLKTNIDFNGATEQAKRGLVKAVDRFENAGGTVGNAKVVFGGTLGNYGYYDPKTNTIHLRTNENFVEKMLEENARSMFKLGKPRWADPTYEGMAAHELGHAFDRYFGQEISREISRRGLLREAFSISGYASTEPAIGSPRASEAVAENIAAYLAGGSEKEKIDSEIIKILEEYFGKRR